ncbi:MAG: DUF2330 domain-containing protein [Myxococcota bacterium]
MLKRLAFFFSLVVPFVAHAFCGFYVAGGGAELFNNATQVVLMRHGTRTVLSMQNNYQGPPSDFAMVIPVPVILQKENVKTLNKAIFDKVDKLGAPRLVEYWEQDPCPKPQPDYYMGGRGAGMAPSAAMPMKKAEAGPARDYGVTIEAKFEVGEYEIVVLSAKDALGLEDWLKDNAYKIPAGAEALFRPYIQQGLKFFVAKVDSKKVQFDDKGMATLSPLRFHYDSEKFFLPVRLGLINAKDKQDLIVSILARNQRYEVANFTNVTIPTNIDLVPSAKSEFGPFYASLFDRTQKKTPGSVVTEYAWDSSTCDPCPTPALNQNDLMILGLDVLDGDVVQPEITVSNFDKLPPDDQQFITQSLDNVKRQFLYRKQRGGARFVLTRLHARYDKTSLGDDLVFTAAKPIVGGREFLKDSTTLETGAVESTVNNFQARYAIRYPWTGPITCANPRRGIWGGPPNGGYNRPTAAIGTPFVKRDEAMLTKLVESPVEELGVKGKKARAGIPVKGR